tara:strand:+ start:151 stop:309 length:159 start_codon:yes stop_codon:yes gene_type:complete
MANLTSWGDGYEVAVIMRQADKRREIANKSIVAPGALVSSFFLFGQLKCTSP